MSAGEPTGGFPSVQEVAHDHLPDSHLPVFAGLVEIRVSQVIAAYIPGETLGMSEAEMRLFGSIMAAVEAAYRLGLRDGLVRLGELA